MEWVGEGGPTVIPMPETPKQSSAEQQQPPGDCFGVPGTGILPGHGLCDGGGGDSGAPLNLASWASAPPVCSYTTH